MDDDSITRIVDLNEVKAAAASHIDAVDGDHRRLAKRLREGAALTPDERRVAADYLDGKPKRKAHRPKSLRTEMKWWLVRKLMEAALKAEESVRWPDKAIVAEAIKRYGISRTDAYDTLKEVRSSLSE